MVFAGLLNNHSTQSQPQCCANAQATVKQRELDSSGHLPCSAGIFYLFSRTVGTLMRADYFRSLSPPGACFQMDHNGLCEEPLLYLDRYRRPRVLIVQQRLGKPKTKTTSFGNRQHGNCDHEDSCSGTLPGSVWVNSKGKDKDTRKPKVTETE